MISTNTAPNPKDLIYHEFARIGKALASPARLEILDLLSQGEKTVEEIADQTRLGFKNGSAHLRALREARLVETRKEPPFVYYRLADEGVLRVVLELQALARTRLAEVSKITRQHFEEPFDMREMDATEILRRVDSDEITLLDVRPAGEFRAGHIPGAVSIPIGELERRVTEVPRDRPVVVYCRGPFCAYAGQAVEVLRDHGIAAERMPTGVAEWRFAGQRVVVDHEVEPLAEKIDP